jgi:hypothetical protein
MSSITNMHYSFDENKKTPGFLSSYTEAKGIHVWNVLNGY